MNFVRKIRGLRLGHDGSLDVGKALGSSKNQTYDAARAGEIPTIKIGRCLRVSLAALNKMLEEVGQEVSVPPRNTVGQNGTRLGSRANAIDCIARGGRKMSRGHIRSRGPGAWELKYDVEDRAAHHQVQGRAGHQARCPA